MFFRLLNLMRLRSLPKSTVKAVYKVYLVGGVMVLGVSFLSVMSIKLGNETACKVLPNKAASIMEPERLHTLFMKLTKLGFLPKITIKEEDEKMLETTVMGLNFKNVVGLAAGFDKNATIFTEMAKLGFGFIEVGTVTPLPQKGNTGKRLYRLKEDRGIINRMGFNNLGSEEVLNNILNNKSKLLEYDCVLGVNIGVNATTKDVCSDFRTGYNAFYGSVDYIVINVSSPNTEGLREHQTSERLNAIINAVNSDSEITSRATDKLRPKLLIKIAPDLKYSEMDEIIECIMNNKRFVDGVILTNTSTQRDPSLKSTYSPVYGGLSGAPIKNLSTRLIRYFYEKTRGTIPIIGVGGVFTGRDAYEKIINGASLVQVYTSITYEGPYVVRNINQELAAILRENKFVNVQSAVGSAVKFNKEVF